MTKVAFFDMNETTLALEPLDSLFDSWFSTTGIRRVWFQRLLHTTMMNVLIGPHRGFGDLATTSLHAVAEAHGVVLPDSAMAELATAIVSLPVHADVQSGLEALRVDGWRLVALTNSDQSIVEGQLANAAIDHFFEHIISVENLQTFKPVANVYLHAARIAGVDPSESWMVASHDWDLEAAKNVGMKTVFVRRPGTSFSHAYQPADVTCDDFGGLAEAMGSPSGQPPCNRSS